MSIQILGIVLVLQLHISIVFEHLHPANMASKNLRVQAESPLGIRQNLQSLHMP